MKKALMFSFVLSFGMFICSCTGMFGDVLGTSNTTTNGGTPADTTGGHHGCDSLHFGGGHHNDHDADDSTAVTDSTVHIRYGFGRH